MSGLEETFNISLETDDIVDFSSFKKGIEILKNIRLIEKSMQKELFYENFKKQLIKRGFKEGDTILLTCDILKFLLYFRKKNHDFDANKFLDLFIEIIGKSGT